MSQMYERTRDEVRESWLYRAGVAILWWAASRVVLSVRRRTARDR